MSNGPQVREYHGRRCPRCGSTLITNGRYVWCTFIGNDRGPHREPSCGYGIDNPVLHAPEPAGAAQLSSALKGVIEKLKIES